MTLIVEDGSIVTGANSYVTLANAETYWGNQGYSLSGITSTEQTNGLIAAAYAMDKLFGRYYVGRAAKYSPQNLLWPRQYNANSWVQLFACDPTGTGAKFLVRVIDGTITNVYILAGGQNYSSTPTLQFNTGMDAAATATVVSGVITAVTVTNAGQNFPTPEPITDNDYTIININEIPQALQDAQCEIAWVWLQDGNIFPELSDEQKFKQLREQIGGFNLIQTYNDARLVDGEQLQGFRKIELILTPIITNDHYNF
jgi:hypothetical protein